MCHQSPAATALGLVVTIGGVMFAFWHIWSFDRGRCLIYHRRGAFRWVITWMLILSLILFMSWDGLNVYVKYTEGYAAIPLSPTETEIMPVPYLLWSKRKTALVRAAYYCMAIGWACLLAIHGEETLYWMYLIRAIRTRDPRSWFQSLQFKVWLACAAIGYGVMIGCTQINPSDLLSMEENLFLAGSISALILMISSFWLISVFPGFIRESIKQGANPDVIARLQYFKELNTVRTFLRAVYSVAIATLAFDGKTKHRYINTTPFWSDMLFIIGMTTIFASTAISIMILLPRSMAHEAGVHKQTPVFVQQQRYNNAYPPHPYQYRHDPASVDSELATPTTAEFAFIDPWGVLNERLNLDKMEMTKFAESQIESHAVSQTSERISMPFSAQPGARILREGEEVGDIPTALEHFVAPLDNNYRQGPVDLNIVVTTQTVVEKE
ncbi:hypothetical protein M231_01775 [Tremella mesenterica]|uniref:Uncharacterized protein n=1 Tax=Tremella mesenterica TaxID=5217 RepID=A0A4V1M4M9_TREME|nr:uncharacterized protein TREMEDRAFT_60074 [Tremella mesenterica DSM 1558]EIW71140.1 hypothetical protein TREMEDRAFT_60074 [Tremella mesenterica DSM 1558]RXK40927.1 hypothetical protein M231_01775 [Tremella mesenterica]